MPQISGELIFPSDTQDFTGARVLFRVEDTGLQDVAAAVHHETLLHDVAFAPRLAFNLDVPPANSNGLTLFVHVDMDHSANITRGDYITAQSYPVMRDTNDLDIISVELERV